MASRNSHSSYFLRTERLWFRSWTEDDLDLAGAGHVGCCGLRPHDPPARIYELGVHIRSLHWRRGFAAEAGSAVIGHAFGRLQAAGLFAGHNPENHASRRLLEKLGFRYTHDELYPPTGSLHPSYMLMPARR